MNRSKFLRKLHVLYYRRMRSWYQKNEFFLNLGNVIATLILSIAALILAIKSNSVAKYANILGEKSLSLAYNDSTIQANDSTQEAMLRTLYHISIKTDSEIQQIIALYKLGVKSDQARISDSINSIES